MIKTTLIALMMMLSASTALAQDFGMEDPETDTSPGSISQDVYLRPISGQDPDALLLEAEIRKELERSRLLNVVGMSARALHIEAPVKITRSADGAKIEVRYELTPPRGDPQSFSANCRPARLDSCADLIVQRTERFARETTRRR